MNISFRPVFKSGESRSRCEQRDFLQVLALKTSFLEISRLHHLDKCQCITALKLTNSYFRELTVLQNGELAKVAVYRHL